MWKFEHDQKAAILMSKMTKLVVNYDYNKDAIAENWLNIDEKDFLDSDLATSFLVIEDFESRIKAKKVKKKRRRP